MYKRIKKAKLGRTKSHRESLRRNLLRSLFDKNTVITTTPRAKALKKDASSLIENAKKSKDSIVFKRKLVAILGNDNICKKFNTYLAKEDIGVCIVKVGFRDGDNAEKSKVYLKGMQKKKIVKKKEEDINKEVKKNTNDKKMKSINKDKKVDKTAVIKKVGRSTSRSGL